MPTQLSKDMQDFKDTAAKFASGVTIVTVKTDNDFHAMTVSAFSTISMDPLLVMVSISNKSKMHDILLNQKKFSISILEESQSAVSNHFAGQKQHDLLGQDFGKANMISIDENFNIINEAAGFFLCDLDEAYEKGDHTLFFGKVIKSQFVAVKKPLIYYSRGYSLIK